MRAHTILLLSASACLVLTFGACDNKEGTALTQNPTTGGGGGAAPDYVTESCDWLCNKTVELGCGLTDCNQFNCSLKEFESYAGWCQPEINAVAVCQMELPDLQLNCANGQAFVDEAHYLKPCEKELAAMRICLDEGPSGALPEDMTGPCQQRCALFAGLPCGDPSTCEGECANTMADATECNAVKASFLLCALDNGATAFCDTPTMGEPTPTMNTPPQCLNLGQEAFDCEFGDPFGM
jgi:hypothetical protein